MNDISGRTSGKLFAIYDPDSHSLRMWPATGLWGSIEFLQTLPRTGWMSSGRVYERPTLERPTIGSDCLSWRVLPTPRAQARENVYARADYHSNLEEAVAMMPHVQELLAPSIMEDLSGLLEDGKS